MIRLTRTALMSATDRLSTIKPGLAIAAGGLIAVALGACGGATVQVAAARPAAYRGAAHHRRLATDERAGRRRYGHRADRRRGDRRRHDLSAAQEACAAADMSLRWVTMTAGMFHYADMYAVTNTGGSACTLDGFPTVKMVDTPTSGGAAVPVSDGVQDDNSAPFGGVPTAITLERGASAGLIISYVADPENPACLTPTTFAVTLPGTTTPLTSDRTGFNVCQGGQVYVSPVLPQAQFPTSGP
jgi:hypothetical protein